MTKTYKPVKQVKGFAFCCNGKLLTGVFKTAKEASEAYRTWCIEHNDSLTDSGLHVDNFPGIIEFETYY